MVVMLVAQPGADARILQLDVAGLPLAQHLRSNVAATKLAVFENQPIAALPDDSVLLVDSDVWFSAAALTRLVEALAGSAEAVRVVSNGDVLATYLPVSRDVTGSREIECRTLSGPDDAPAMRVRQQMDVVRLERHILYERACRMIEEGTRIRDPRQIAIRGELQCGTGVEIDLGVIVEGVVRLGEGVKIGAYSILIDATLGAHSIVKPYSIIEGAAIGEGATVGPYGRVRPGTAVGARAQIGNFVEIKNAEIGAGARINHLAFIGDATLGESVTIGAGTITCNHSPGGTLRTAIGNRAYIGSGTELVAPVTIGDGATIAAGSTITEDAPPGTLTIARARQVTIPGWSPRAAKTDRK